MSVKTILAFDFGEKRIGVSVGNTQLRQAQHLGTIRYKGIDEAFRAVKKLLDEWQPNELVVGLPRHPDGAPHEMTQRATRFGNQLKGRFNLPVNWVDERYTSVTVDDAQGDIDTQAAGLILEQYFSESMSGEAN
jgi:putative Holliday junction resolvase